MDWGDGSRRDGGYVGGGITAGGSGAMQFVFVGVVFLVGVVFVFVVGSRRRLGLRLAMDGRRSL